MELLKSGMGERTIALDPRTKLILLFCVSTVLIVGGNGPIMFIVRTVMVLFPFALVAISGRIATSLVMLAVYGASYALVVFVSPFTTGLANTFIIATSTVVMRFMPTLALGYFIFSTTTVSEFMAAMHRMHMPDWLTIPLSVLFRFFPTLGQEAKSITAAMRMRGISPFRNGIAYIEYALVPLMNCAVNIGEDLSAAALTRGLGAPIERTNICQIGFKVQDILCIAISLTATAILTISLIFPGTIA